MHTLVVTTTICLVIGFAASLPTSESQASSNSRQFDGPGNVEIQRLAEESRKDVQLDGGKDSFFNQPFWKDIQFSNKMKREIGSTSSSGNKESPESPESPDIELSQTSSSSSKQQEEVSDELPANMLELREQVAGLLLAQSGMLDLDRLRPIADEAVRKLMEEVSALGDDAKQPKSLVTLSPDLIDSDEARYGNRIASSVRDKAYKLAWANQRTRTQGYVRKRLNAEFGIYQARGDLRFYAREAEDLVAKEFKALEDASADPSDNPSWIFVSSRPDTKHLIGRILQQTVKEAREKNLSEGELENLLRGYYPNMIPSIRSRIARAAVILFVDEEYL